MYLSIKSFTFLDKSSNNKLILEKRNRMEREELFRDLYGLREDYDLVIVGAGLSGSVIAQQASEISGLKSLVIDKARNHPPQIMEGSTGNFRIVLKKSTSLGRIIGFWQYTVRSQCEPKSLQPACTKFSNTSIVTAPTFIISESTTI